jgi:hypothetical protein
MSGQKNVFQEQQLKYLQYWGMEKKKKKKKNKEKVERDKSATEGDITPCTSEILKLIT